MNRKEFVAGLASMFASLGFSSGGPALSPQEKTRAEARASYEVHRRMAIAMNEAAANIRSLEDARTLVDRIARIFADQLPPMWVTRSARDRVARAEYQAAANPSQLIPEQRIADVWNQYIREIDAAEEWLVNPAEIHNLRDGAYASGQLFWERGNQSIWTMSNIYAIGADGKVAGGCRARESLRVLYDLARSPENLRGVRERMHKGILASDSIREYRQKAALGQVRSRATIRAGVRTNPIETAERRYIAERGSSRLMLLAQGWFEDLFPA